MTPSAPRRFDATWLPFGMMLGFTVGIGFGLAVIDNLFLGALVGFGVGAGFGILLGFRAGRRGGRGLTDEDAEDDYNRRLHGDPGPQGGDSRRPPHQRP
ncbi:hypothetical protein ACT3SP_15840 [Brachybacterium sp. AOP43-C2-M15]|uniref:hypothetical protein n=1 Tax=Brachybacterium sp. AOP43-C2-M15 TaxID=3457661 RepID=UPI0040333D73